jgi:hypothetical protein
MDAMSAHHIVIGVQCHVHDIVLLVINYNGCTHKSTTETGGVHTSANGGGVGNSGSGLDGSAHHGGDDAGEGDLTGGTPGGGSVARAARLVGLLVGLEDADGLGVPLDDEGLGGACERMR